MYIKTFEIVTYISVVCCDCEIVPFIQKQLILFLITVCVSLFFKVIYKFKCLKMFLFVQVISGHTGWVRSVAVEPGNQWFATGSADRTIKVSVNDNDAVLQPN